MPFQGLKKNNPKTVHHFHLFCILFGEANCSVMQEALKWILIADAVQPKDSAFL